MSEVGIEVRMEFPKPLTDEVVGATDVVVTLAVITDIHGNLRCADRILDDYDDVPIRTHVLTLAHKQARECLRQPVCGVLERAVR